HARPDEVRDRVPRHVVGAALRTRRVHRHTLDEDPLFGRRSQQQSFETHLSLSPSGPTFSILSSNYRIAMPSSSRCRHRHASLCCTCEKRSEADLAFSSSASKLGTSTTPRSAGLTRLPALDDRGDPVASRRLP